ncbi:serine hydroxymethyltransferase [Candidatus Azambacteria bacterium]|nr:serine hydroxymethyltransferase [Candidatus Azambacteria bacterium]
MNLKKTDKKIYDLIKKEIKRQKEEISLIASENYVSVAVLEALGTPLTNKYSEGYPNKRYYAGNEVIDKIETLAIERAKKIFSAEHANVQPHSGSQANTAVYLALLKPGDTVLGIDLSSGGHLTHGSPVNISGKFYKFHNYGVNKNTEMLDYQEIEKTALAVRPKLIVCGTTAYPRSIDFKKFREIADKVGSYLMADIAHIAGLVVAGEHPHPFPHCDVVTSTTHKTLRGPRGGLILCKQTDRLDKENTNLAGKIDKAVFPGIQGGPLDHVVAAKAVSFLEASKPIFKKYIKQVVKNAKAMAKEFEKNGVRVVSGSTDNHIVLLDVSKYSESSKKTQNDLEEVGIIANRNTIPYETKSPFDPSGIRLGTPSITTRGFNEKDSVFLADLIIKIIKEPTAKNKREVKKEVAKLAKKHSIY